MNDESTKVRLDKWLWAARFYKTRALAKQMIDGGKVHYNGSRAKSSRNVEVGAMLMLQTGWDKREIEVLALSDQRRGAQQAQELYRETPASIERRAREAEQRKLMNAAMGSPDHRPNKKDRRQLMDMKARRRGD